jgi:SnoaL-like domain
MAAAEQASLEQRLRAVEDRFAIHQLIMSYPLAVDTRSLDYVTEVWTEDGVFDRGAGDPHKHSGDFDGAYGKTNIMNEVGSPQLQASREAGLAHIMTAPHITVDGDEAAATNYTVLVVGKGDDCRVRRPSANRWDLVRVDGKWLIKRRTLRLIDGSNGSRELFRTVFGAR